MNLPGSTTNTCKKLGFPLGSVQEHALMMTAMSKLSSGRLFQQDSPLIPLPAVEQESRLQERYLTRTPSQ